MVLLLSTQLVLVALTFVAVALVSGNRLSTCVGTAVGARVISKRTGAAVGALGFSLGLALQGSEMVHSTESLLPNQSPYFASGALIVTILVFFLAIIIRAPLTVTISLVSVLAGISFAHRLPIDQSYLITVVLAWFVTPVVSLFASLYAIRAISKIGVDDFRQRIRGYKIALVALSFAASFSAGANNIGFIVAVGGYSTTIVVVAIVAIVLGCFVLSSGQLKRIGEEFFLLRYTNALSTLVVSTVIVEFATLFSIPLSNTQAMSTALLGAGLSYKTRLLTLKPFLVVVLGWLLAAVLSFAAGLLI